MHATIAIAPRRPKKNVVQRTGHMYSTAPSPAPGVVVSAYAIVATPIGPSAASPQRGSREPIATSSAVIAIATRTGGIAKPGSPGSKPSIEPSKAAPPYIAAAVYAISLLSKRSLSSEGPTPLISAHGPQYASLDVSSGSSWRRGSAIGARGAVTAPLRTVYLRYGPDTRQEGHSGA